MEIRPLDLAGFWVCGSMKIRVLGGCLGLLETTDHGGWWQLVVCLLFGFGRKVRLRSMKIRSLDLVGFWVCWLMGIRVLGWLPLMVRNHWPWWPMTTGSAFLS